jgi:hypothetical protein
MKMSSTKIIIILIAISSISAISFTPVTTSDILINTTTAADQIYPQVAALDNDNFVVIWWHSVTAADDVKAQIFDKKGNKVGTEFSPSIVTANVQIWPFASSIGSGKFLLAWNDYDGSTRDTAKARIFNNDGTPVTGEIICNTYVSGLGDQLYTKAFGNPLNGNSVVVWQLTPPNFDAKASFLNSSGTITTKDITVNSYLPGDESCPFPCFLTNGNTVITYHSNKNGTYDIFYKIYNSTGTSVIKTDAVANSYIAGTQSMAQCAGLTGGGFVVYFKSTYWGNTVDFAFRVFDASGNAVTATDIRLITPTRGVDNWSTVRAMPNGGFMAVYDMYEPNYSNGDVSFQTWAYDGTNTTPEKNALTYNTGAQGNSGGSVFKDGSIVAVWQSASQVSSSSGWDIFGQIFQFKGDCYAFQTFLGILDANQVSFTSLPNATLNITKATTVGVLQDSNNVTLNTTTYFPNTGIYYKTTVTTSDSFYYINSKGDLPCKVDITICYTSCKSCAAVGDSTNNKCISCLNSNNYYPLSDNPSNCLINTTPVPNYYFDQTDKMFKPCFVRCSACTTAGTTNNNLCTTCASGYYPLADKTSQCYKSTETVSNYFFDATKFTPCDISCLGCTGSATACTACNNTAGYYSMSGKCTKVADVPQYYYFDPITKQIKKCYDSCNTCNGDGTIDMHYCVTCKANYFTLDDKPANCYSTTTITDGYYLQGTVFLPCFKTCKTCTGSGSISNPNCTSCKSGLSCAPCTQIVYNDQCINGCPDGLVYDSVNKTCYACKDRNQFLLNGKCVDKCPDDNITYKYTCYPCSFNNQVVYQGACADSCPPRYQNNNGVCERIPTTSSTTTGTDGSTSSTQNTSSSTATTSTNTATSTDNTNINTNTSTSNTTSTQTTSDTTLCTATICKNNGVCSVKYNQVSCTCPSQYTGTYCEIINNPQSLPNTISNIFLTQDQLINSINPLDSNASSILANINKILQDNPTLATSTVLNKLANISSI